MSEAGRALASDLPQRLPTIRNLVLEELAVRQGERGGINYIDPRPLVEYLSVGGDDLSLGEIDIPTTMADYPEIGRLASSPWGRLSDVLKDESDALRTRIESLETLVRQWRVVGCAQSFLRHASIKPKPGPAKPPTNLVDAVKHARGTGRWEVMRDFMHSYTYTVKTALNTTANEIKISGR